MSFGGVPSFWNSARFHRRAHPRVEGGRGVGAFIFDKVHLQVSHRDAFSRTHPASAGAQERGAISTLRTRNCYMCRSRAGCEKAARAIVLLQMTRKLKSAGNPRSLAPEKSIVMRMVWGGLALLTAPPPTEPPKVKESRRLRPSHLLPMDNSEEINHNISRITPQFKLGWGLRGWKMNSTAEELPALGGCWTVRSLTKLS